MRLLITGVCGFVGSSIAKALLSQIEGLQITGLDNLLRPGSETNRAVLLGLGVNFIHGDIRNQSDIDALPDCDWVIDAAAQPSVLAGVDGKSSPRQLYEHNLGGTLNVLEYCRIRQAGFVLLSTSRVYSITHLANLPMTTHDNAFVLNDHASLTAGVSSNGVAESFPTQAPISLYGATKLASEIMALEAGQTFQFPVWVNRCGVLAGAGQFGTAEQGIFSYWLHAFVSRRPLRYIGFGGHGYQVRDAFHPDDLAALLRQQLTREPLANPILNVGGGPQNAMSLAQLNAWCQDRFGPHTPQPDSRPRPFDIPWFVMDHTRTTSEFGWKPQRSLSSILDEIADHVRSHPSWLRHCGVR